MHNQSGILKKIILIYNLYLKVLNFLISRDFFNNFYESILNLS